ncbi:MAG TPA: ATP-binding cassette domain-containing protein [Lacibacter sp.]|nr:ATP-binding cassette domain-containing protein [Lacibacter sp.]HMO88827.1 ATP-binding cassette domain-containing protein [Lacibacter sp.]HMP85865.1 ATP-binding cassette domain-containing protein [Lacibacter sp.]
MSILTIHQLAKTYGRVQALKGVSFDVPEGAVFGILGPNGSGKTTLLSIVLGVLGADSGHYEWFGQTASPDLRNQIGSLLETPNFYHYLSAVNNLRITHSISGRGDADGIEAVLHKVKLHERRRSRFSTYSLGMKQRLAIAAALLGEPRILVLDEPTNGLDPVGIAEIRELIIELSRKGHTVIMASHLLDEVEKVCTHVAILKTGTLVAAGPVHDVLVDEDIVELAAADIPRLRTVVEGFPGVHQVVSTDHFVQLYFPKGTAALDQVNEHCFRKGVVLHHLLLKRKRLEEKFFELTG